MLRAMLHPTRHQRIKIHQPAVPCCHPYRAALPSMPCRATRPAVLRALLRPAHVLLHLPPVPCGWVMLRRAATHAVPCCVLCYAPCCALRTYSSTSRCTLSGFWSRSRAALASGRSPLPCWACRKHRQNRGGVGVGGGAGCVSTRGFVVEGRGQGRRQGGRQAHTEGCASRMQAGKALGRPTRDTYGNRSARFS